MKTILSKFIITLILSILIFSSCTIEKRRYSSGYHMDWHQKRDLFSKQPKQKVQVDALAPIQKNKLQTTEVNTLDSARNKPTDSIITQDSGNASRNYTSIIKKTNPIISSIEDSVIVSNNTKESVYSISENSTIITSTEPNEPTETKNTSAGGIVFLILGIVSLIVGILMWAAIAGAASFGGALFLGFLGLGLGVLGVIFLISAAGFFIQHKNKLQRTNAKQQKN